jgi:thioredoxin 1
MKHILYFTADWCGPCKKVRPIVEEINKESIEKFMIINVDTEMDLAKNHNVSSVPTFILFENGQEVKRSIGAQTKEQLLGLLKYEKTIQENV